ncbi:PDZ domain-containing protein [Streptomyces sp. cg35]|uniref:PDZ domain-containing protein n=1 Tax=Streptomyces sp. cg35 TaxID=3421650 RepID=UPI003D172444
MEQTALRPKSMPGSPGRDPAGPGPESRPARRPHAARPRGRRLVGMLAGVLCALVLVLAGVGLGTVGATVIGMSRLAEMQRQAAAAGPAKPSAPPARSAAPIPAPAAVRGSLGVEVVDAPKGPGALVVAVHVPGPGYTAGLVRGDVLLSLGAAHIGSASDLAAVVADTRPGHQLVMTVRHDSGAQQKLAVTPGVVT